MFKELSGSSDSLQELERQTKVYSKIDNVWWMSKYLGISYCYAIAKARKQNEVTKWLYGYGSSATKNSSIFIKYS